MRIIDLERCYRRGRRKAKDFDRKKRQLLRGLDALIYGRPSSVCIRCGNLGPHFVPPSLGEEGFYICDRRAARGAVKADTFAARYSGNDRTIGFDIETRSLKPAAWEVTLGGRQAGKTAHSARVVRSQPLKPR